MDETEKILHQDILEVLRVSGEGALANPRLFVSSLLDVDAGRTKEAGVLANNCTDQLLSIYSSAGHDAQALHQASSKAKSYLTSKRYLNEDVSAAIADAFEDALCRYYGVVPAAREAIPHMRAQPIPVPQPQTKPKSQPKSQPKPQPKSQPKPQPATSQTSTPQTKSTVYDFGKYMAVWAFAIIEAVMVAIGFSYQLAAGEHLTYVASVMLSAVIALVVGSILRQLLSESVKSKGTNRVFSLVSLLVSLGLSAYFTYGGWAWLSAEGFHMEPMYYAMAFIRYLCFTVIIVPLLLGFAVAIFGKHSRK